MLDVMYDIPSNDKVYKVVITKESIQGISPPELIEGERKLLAEKNTTLKSHKTIETAS